MTSPYAFDTVPVMFVGCGGNAPGIAAQRDRRWALALPVEQGKSVYGLAMSPSAGRLAAAARVRGGDLGYVWVWGVGADKAIVSGPLMQCFQQSAATCVAWLDESRFVSGAVTGEIYLWSLAQREREVRRWSAHHGPVLALATDADGTLLSVGADAVVHRWIASEGREVGTWSAGAAGEGAPDALLAIQPVPDASTTIISLPSGQLGRLSTTGDLALITVTGYCCGFAVVGDNLIVADRLEPRLRVFDVRSEQEMPVTHPLRGPVYCLSALNAQTLAVGYRDGTVDLITVKGLDFSNVTAEGVNGARCIIGLPRALQLESRDRAGREARARLHEEAERALAEGRASEVRTVATRMGDLGLRTEALLFHAESYALEQASLHELRYRLRFAESVPDDPIHCEPLYRLATLLERVREPARACVVFRRVESISPGFRDAAARADKLQDAMIPLVVPGAIVETFGNQIEPLLQEIEKWAVLGDRWSWASVIHRDDRRIGAGTLEPESALRDAFHDVTQWTVGPAVLVDITMPAPREAFLAQRVDATTPWLSATVEISREADGWHALTRWVVAGSDEGSADAVALEVGRRIAE